MQPGPGPSMSAPVSSGGYQMQPLPYQFGPPPASDPGGISSLMQALGQGGSIPPEILQAMQAAGPINGQVVDDVAGNGGQQSSAANLGPGGGNVRGGLASPSLGGGVPGFQDRVGRLPPGAYGPDVPGMEPGGVGGQPGGPAVLTGPDGQKPPSQIIQQGYGNRAAAEAAMQAAGGTGTLRNWLAGQAQGAPTPGAAVTTRPERAPGLQMKPFVPPGLQAPPLGRPDAGGPRGAAVGGARRKPIVGIAQRLPGGVPSDNTPLEATLVRGGGGGGGRRRNPARPAY